MDRTSYKKYFKLYVVTYTCKNGKKVTFSADYGVGFKTAHSTRRSKTFWGIAKAMAEQWG